MRYKCKVDELPINEYIFRIPSEYCLNLKTIEAENKKWFLLEFEDEGNTWIAISNEWLELYFEKVSEE